MTATSKKILFFGNEKLATGATTKAPVFSGLLNAGYQILALILAQDHDLEALEVVRLAKSKGVPVLSFNDLRDPKTIAEIAALKAGSAVLAAYGKIIPESVLDLFETGIINIHPSLLPKHRGPSPIESTILCGDTETGVSLIRLVKAMDAGPIFKQQTIKLKGDETKQGLVDSLGQLGSRMLLDSIDDILDGSLEPYEQDDQQASYDKLITKADGVIDWQDTYKKIDRKVRAFEGWPGTKAQLRGIEVSVITAHFESENGTPGDIVSHDGQPGVYCSDGLVILDQVLPSGKRPMAGRDFLLGYSQRLF